VTTAKAKNGLVPIRQVPLSAIRPAAGAREYGRREPGLSSAAKLARALGVSLDELAGPKPGKGGAS
jgi:hypothetical protein